MSALSMNRNEREAFLAQAHVGVISIADPARGVVAVPIWYDYDPTVGVWVITDPRSIKGKALHAAGRYAMTVQVSTFPYRYVSVEGPIIEERDTSKERDLRPMAIRYNGKEDGDAYADSYPENIGHVYVMRPERWLTQDLTKVPAETFTEKKEV